jgi:FkbM family methyltransferase
MATRDEPALTDDAFLGGAVLAEQPAAGYRSGLDAVLLAAAAPVRPGAGEHVLDLGAGVGVVGLCVAARIADAKVTLVEREPALVAIAARNIARNGVAERVRVLRAAVGDPAPALAAAGLGPDSAEHSLANPPYGIEGRGRAPKHTLKAGASTMPERALEDWARLMAHVTRPGGSATVIHRADALGTLLAAFAPRFGGVRVLPVHAREGEPAIRVLVQGRKGSRAPLALLPGLVLHAPGGGYRAEVEAVLRTPKALPIDS